MVETMLCYSKLEQLFHRVYPALRNFPVAEKYALSQEIKLSFLNAMKYMQLGNSVKSKRKEYLMQCEGELLHLTAVMRLCRNQRYISKGFFADIDLCLTEIKKLLNGWIKQTINSAKDSRNKPKDNLEVNNEITQG